MTLTEHPDYVERFAVGRSHGWDHAAYVDACGTMYERPAPTYDGDNATPGEIGYADGWQEGTDDYAADSEAAD